MERKPHTELTSETPLAVERPIRATTYGAPAAHAAALVRVADALFDLTSSEREGATLPDEVAFLDFVSMLPSEERLLGIVAACAIPGCDIHFVTVGGQILNHVGHTEALPPAFAPARALLLDAGADVVAVAVFETKLQFLCLDGSLRPVR